MSEELQTTVAEEQQTPTQSATTTETPARFIDGLAEEIRNEPSLQNIQDVNQLAKGYVHAQRMVGADKIALPNKHATEDDWNQFYGKLGRPDSPEAYEINYTAPYEGYEATNLPGFQDAAFRAGLNTDQAQLLLDWYSELETETLQSNDAASETHRLSAEQDLRQEYGLAYDKKLAEANGVFQKFFGSEMAQVVLEDGSLLGNNAQFIRALTNLAQNFSEDTITADQHATGAMTPQEANAEISKLTAPGTAYWDKLHPNHQQAVDDVFKLRQMAHPDLAE
tara:strand:- start:4743 stop:5582 length:840 start_codon:yes stop_codon:yes gene_type:complete